MGRLAKQRRSKVWVAEKKVRELKLQIRDAVKSRDAAKDELRHLEQRVREFCAYSTLLRAEAKIGREVLRVPIRDRLYHARYENREIQMMDTMPVEALMHLIAHSPVGDDFRRCVHFLVVNPPGKRQTVGYAVSHRELAMFRGRRDAFVRMIADRMAAHVWAQLYPHEEHGT